VEASLTPVTSGSKGSIESVGVCPAVTLQMHPARKGLSRTQRRRRQREKRMKASSQVHDLTTIAQHKAVTATAVVGPSGSVIVSNATPELQEWRVRTDLGEGVLADLLPDLS